MTWSLEVANQRVMMIARIMVTSKLTFKSSIRTRLNSSAR